MAQKKAALKEEELKENKKKSELQSQLEILSIEQEVASAEAEARVYEEEDDRESQILDDLDIPGVDLQLNVENYLNSAHPNQGEVNFPQEINKPNIQVQHELFRTHDRRPELPYQVAPRPVVRAPTQIMVRSPERGFVQNQTDRSTIHNTTQNNYEDISRFLCIKDLLLSRLVKFTDKPETYYVWKTTFHSVTNELKLSELEELDLLQF
jgi:hypothetical protein